MNHLLGIGDLTKDDIETYLDKAQYYAGKLGDDRDYHSDALKNKIIVNAFFENSTRTLLSFEMAARRLGADIVNWDKENSSLSKGESFEDTIRTIDAMYPSALIMRHSGNGAPVDVARQVEHCCVINAGDGSREHPTQALLDALTMKLHFGKLKELVVAIVGDIAHSRVAASNMILLTKMGATVRVIAPKELMPSGFPVDNIQPLNDLREGIKGADVIMSIRPQKERMQDVSIKDDEYFRDYGLTYGLLNLADTNAVVLDPGPFNRGLQISEDLANDRARFLYDWQVSNGIATRMAVLDLVVSGES